MAQVRAAIATAFASHNRLLREKDRARSLTTLLQRMGGAVFVVDGDGRITANDVKVCMPQCTRASCATQAAQ